MRKLIKGMLEEQFYKLLHEYESEREFLRDIDECLAKATQRFYADKRQEDEGH